MLKRRAYISNLTFHTDTPIPLLHPILEKVSRAVTAEVTDNFGRKLEYQPAGIIVTYDPRTTQIGTSPFTIQMRDGAPYKERKYFSAAPLRTQVHISLLEPMEKELAKR